MARGGKRIGAGRKAGAVTRRTRTIADKATAEGLTPLEVMLTAMRVHAKAQKWDDAASIAKDAAPYMHPRLASLQHTGRNGGPIQTVDLTKLSGDELDQLEAIIGPLADIGADQGGEGETGR
ncbi:hypothetical protein NKH73_14110 [Mesorhizobium sp. M0938]|uniref:hypothetical protein n=1 Tax=unclassified Mesorhizobium TaxID=325217 RepID=UPI00333D2A9F